MSAATVLACLAAAGAAAALTPAAPRRPGAEGPGWPALLVIGPVLGLAVAVRPATGALALVVAGVGLASVRLWVARRRRERARRTAARVLETCELLRAELDAGQPPGRALSRAAEEWAALAPVAETFRVGGDVPAALRVAAGRDGAADLRLVAGAWQVAHRTGRGLAGAVDAVASDLRAAAATRRVVEGELASARATARLVAGLPVLALTMGSGAGGDPWGFLLSTVPGLACLAGGCAMGLLGLAWIEGIARDVDRSS